MFYSVNSASSQYNGISGLASGLDTESMIEKLLVAEQEKVNSLKGQKQKYEWQQEAYRSVINKLDEFNSNHFDIINKENYILSSSGLRTVNVSNLSNTASRYVDISANADAIKDRHVINEISQLATASSVSSTTKVIGSVSGNVDLSAMTYPLDYSAGTSFGISLDGILKQIELKGTYNDVASLINDINSELDASFGTGRVIASLSADNELSFSATNSSIQVFSGTSGSDFLADVGITNGSRNILSLDSTLEQAFGETANVIEFKINDVHFSFNKAISIRDIVREINSSAANVHLSYSSLKDEFTLTSNETGESASITIENVSGNLFGVNSHININDSLIQNGTDAVFYLDDETKTNPIKRNSNYFTIDDVTYSLKEVTSESIDYSVEQNTEGVLDKIKSFVNSFNELMADLSGRLNEKVYYDYQPLTDEQKDEMTDRQVELWEEKTKSGLLRRDPILMKLDSAFKKAFWDKTEGINSSLYDIGLKTSRDYNVFTIEIDEAKLTEAIKKDASLVLDVFNKEDIIDYKPTLSAVEKNYRYNTNGFAQRVSDIINDNITTFRNNYGQKGLLVEKAGLEDDPSDIENDMLEKIKKMEKRIEVAIDKMNSKENYYRKQFTAMETALQRMYSQSDWLYSQFSN